MFFVKKKDIKTLIFLSGSCTYVKKRAQREYFFYPDTLGERFFCVPNTKPISVYQELDRKRSEGAEGKRIFRYDEFLFPYRTEIFLESAVRHKNREKHQHVPSLYF